MVSRDGNSLSEVRSSSLIPLVRLRFIGQSIPVNPLTPHTSSFPLCTCVCPQPDEFAPDAINPAILESLLDAAVLPQIHLRSAAADMNGGYLPPPDAVLMRGVEAGSEPGIEYDADSEEEMEELAQVWAVDGFV